MELGLKRKIPLFALATCIFLEVVFAGILSVDTHDHDCIGLDCSTCLVIKAGQNFLKTLKFTGFLLFAALLTLFAHIFKNDIGRNAHILSPVTLKVRFNS